MWQLSFLTHIQRGEPEAPKSGRRGSVSTPVETWTGAVRFVETIIPKQSPVEFARILADDLAEDDRSVQIRACHESQKTSGDREADL